MVATASTTQQERPIHLSSRQKQETISRLRTGRMSHHLFNKLRIGESALCPFRSTSQTTEHLLQVLILHAELLSKYWKDAIPLATKLYGSQKDLRHTVTFSIDMELRSKRTRKRKNKMSYSSTTEIPKNVFSVLFGNPASGAFENTPYMLIFDYLGFLDICLIKCLNKL